MYEIADQLNGFLDLLNHIENNWDSIYDGIGQADRETQDILHEMELTSFNASEGYALAKKLQEVRQRRRRLKNEKEALKDIKEFYEHHKQLKIDLFKVLTKKKQTLETQANRKYMPRVRDDLKLAQKGA